MLLGFFKSLLKKNIKSLSRVIFYACSVEMQKKVYKGCNTKNVKEGKDSVLLCPSLSKDRHLHQNH